MEDFNNVPTNNQTKDSIEVSVNFFKGNSKIKATGQIAWGVLLGAFIVVTVIVTKETKVAKILQTNLYRI
jgi:hypothetical protein